MEMTTGKNWRKSSYSSANGGNCVEAGQAPGTVLIRDTKNNGTGPALRITPADWQRFTKAIRASADICLAHESPRFLCQAAVVAARHAERSTKSARTVSHLRPVREQAAQDSEFAARFDAVAAAS